MSFSCSHDGILLGLSLCRSNHSCSEVMSTTGVSCSEDIVLQENFDFFDAPCSVLFPKPSCPIHG